MRRRKSNRWLGLLVLVFLSMFFMGVAYSLPSDTIAIEGTVTVIVPEHVTITPPAIIPEVTPPVVTSPPGLM